MSVGNCSTTPSVFAYSLAARRLAHRGTGGNRGSERQPGGERLRGAGDGVDGAKGVAEAGLRAGLERYHRQAAGVIEEIEAELGALAEVRQVHLEVDAPLPAHRRPLVGQARYRLEIADQRAPERRE